MDVFHYRDSGYEQRAELLKILAHPARLCIVRNLIEHGARNVSAIYTCLGMPQSTVSQYLGKLKQANIVKGKREGLEIYYMVENPVVVQITETLLKKFQEQQ